MSGGKSYERLVEARAFVLDKVKTMPRYVLTLGSGLTGLTDKMEKEVEFSLTEIPHLRAPTVEGHRGKIVVGKLDGVRILSMQGRLHYYEGYPLEDVVFPFRVFGIAGAEVFFLTNAAGCLDPKLKPSDLVLIRDHINLLGNNPLIGPNDSRLGPRFPDMTVAYDKQLGDTLLQVAAANKISIAEGTYLCNSGPSYETPAEIRMYRSLGASVVGMSTVPETIALRHMGKKVIGLSCVTNYGAGISPEVLEHSDVLKVAEVAYPKLSLLISKVFQKFEEKR